MITDSEILAEDSTPVSNLKAEIVELQAEVRNLKKRLQKIVIDIRLREKAAIEDKKSSAEKEQKLHNKISRLSQLVEDLTCNQDY